MRGPGSPRGPAQIWTCALTHPALPLGRATAHDVNRPANRSVAVTAPSPGTRTWLCVQCMPGTTVSPRVRRFAPPTPPHGLPCFVRQLHRYYHRIGPLFNVHPPISISPTLRRPRPWRWALKRSPRSRQDMYIRPWGLRHRGPVRPLTITMTNILPSTAPIISATRTTHRRRAIPCWLKIRSVPAGTAIMYRFCAHPDTPDCSSDQRIMGFCSGYQARKYLPRDLRCRCRVAGRFRRVSPY